MSRGFEQIERAVRTIFETKPITTFARDRNAGESGRTVAVRTVLDRLKTATAGSRELDCEIYLAINALDEGLRDTLDLANYLGVPHYTTSLDDARLLVPEEAYCVITQRSAAVARIDPGAFVHHRVAAIALCIAALGARED